MKVSIIRNLSLHRTPTERKAATIGSYLWTPNEFKKFITVAQMRAVSCGFLVIYCFPYCLRRGGHRQIFDPDWF